MNVPRSVKTALRITAVFAVVVYLARSVAVNWVNVRSFDWSLDPMLAAVSVVLFAIGYAMLPWIYGHVLRAAGHGIRFGATWNIYWLGNLGRYVPGKVWVILGITYLAEKRGVPRELATASAVYAQVYSLLSSVVFFFIFLIFTGLHDQYTRYIWFGAPILLLFAAGMYPKALERVINLVLIRVGRSPLSFAVSTVDAFKLVGWYLVSWIVMGIGFGVFVMAVAGTGSVSIFQAAVLYVVAYVIGFFALFAPGGIGIREGVLSLLLGSYLPISVGIVIAALIRLVVTIIELTYAGIALSRKG